MSVSPEIPTDSPEKKEILDDNARKFIVDPIDAQFLEENEATSFILTVDWLEKGEDNETKVAYKRFENGDVQILLIAKITTNGNRTSEKQKITEEKYKELAAASVLHLEKKRYEFKYVQNGIPFSLKYDEYADSDLRILEVDASSEEERDSFIPSDFPSRLAEVTGDSQYVGYKVADVI